MNSMELPLVFFTVLGQAAVGLTVMTALAQYAGAGRASLSAERLQWLIAIIALGIGLGASLFHLGHPGGGVRTLVHLSSSWLSREVLAFFVFGALLLIALWAIWKEAGASILLVTITAIVGLLALAASGMAYAPPSFPALNNGVPIFLFVLTAFILGPAFASLFSGPDKQPMLVKILMVSLVIGLIVNLLLPSIWLSGGRVMQMTGAAYYGSSVYWLRIVFEFGLGIAVLGIMRRIPVWLPLIVLVGECAGRIIFFSEVVHTASNLGGLY